MEDLQSHYHNLLHEIHSTTAEFQRSRNEDSSRERYLARANKDEDPIVNGDTEHEIPGPSGHPGRNNVAGTHIPPKNDNHLPSPTSGNNTALHQPINVEEMIRQYIQANPNFLSSLPQSSMHMTRVISDKVPQALTHHCLFDQNKVDRVKNFCYQNFCHWVFQNKSNALYEWRMASNSYELQNLCSLVEHQANQNNCRTEASSPRRLLQILKKAVPSPGLHSNRLGHSQYHRLYVRP